MKDRLLPPFVIDIAARARPVNPATLADARMQQLLRNVGRLDSAAQILRLTIRPIFLSTKVNDKRWRRRHSLSIVDRIQVQVHAPWPEVEIQGYAPRTRPIDDDDGPEAEFAMAFDLFGFKLGSTVKQELQRRHPRFDIMTAWHASGALQWVFAEGFVDDQEEIVLDLLGLVSAEKTPPLHIDAIYYAGNRIVQSVINRPVLIPKPLA